MVFLNKPTVFIYFFILSMMPLTSMADEVRLTSGAVFQGSLQEITAEHVVFKTPYADALKIPRTDVVAVQTDELFTVTLNNGQAFSGLIRTGTNGTFLQSPELGTQSDPFSLSLIQAAQTPGAAQAAIEAPASQVKTKGNLSVGYSNASGNTDNESLNLSGKFVARTEKNRFTADGEFHQEKDNGVTSEENSEVGLQYDHFLNKKLFAFGNIDLEKDEFQDLNLRTALGGGLGYQIFDDEMKSLSVQGGLNYVNEDFINAEDDEYPSFRWKIDYDQVVWTEWVSIFHEQTGLMGLEQTDDIVITSKSGLKFDLGKGFIAKAQVNLDWDNSPPAGTDGTDTRYILSLGYEW